MLITLSDLECQCSGERYYRICMSDPSGLNGFFVWSLTRQGIDYWEKRFSGNVEMNDSDRLYISLVYFASKTKVREFTLSPAVCARIQPTFQKA